MTKELSMILPSKQIQSSDEHFGKSVNKSFFNNQKLLFMVNNKIIYKNVK